MEKYHARGLHGRVTQSLGARIVSGEFSTDQVLDLDALCAHYGVSRTVIREVIKVLAGKGLVDARQRRGTFPRELRDWNLLDPDVLFWRFDQSPDPQLFADLQEIRVMIEPASARVAARRRSDDDVERISIAVNDMARCQEQGDVEGFVDADVRFHTAVMRASQNELIATLSSIIQVGLAARDLLVHSTLTPSPSTVSAHRRVFDAIVARDGDTADLVMRSLLDVSDATIPGSFPLSL